MKNLISLLVVCTLLSCGTESITTYKFSASVTGEGTVTPSGGEYEEGESVTVTALAEQGWVFARWEGDFTSIQNPATITMDSDKAIIGVFERKNYPLTVSIQGEGTVQERVVTRPKDTEYEFETVVELSSKPEDGWVFFGWEGDMSGNENPKTLEIDNAKEVTSVFKSVEELLSITITGEGAVNFEQESFEDNASRRTITVTAQASQGWKFVEWAGDMAGTDNPKQITITEEKNVTAVFKRDIFTISYTVIGEGQVSDSLVTGTLVENNAYEYESIVELTATPSEGWLFTGWIGDLDGTENPQTVTMDTNKNITATFVRKEYPLSINIEGEGTVQERIVSRPKTTNYPFETVVELTAQASQGWKFVEWAGDLTGTDNPKQITITQEKSVTAAFTEIAYLAENGVTVMCPNGSVGEIGIVNGLEYEVVDRNRLIQRKNEGKDLTKVCTSLVTDMSGMFSGNATFNQDISNWDVSNVTNMRHMFLGASIFNQSIGLWDVGNVVIMEGMFHANYQSYLFNQNLNDWDVSSVKIMDNMFYRAANFNSPLDKWNVSNVASMSAMFLLSGFNQPIGGWDVSSVTNMHVMFWNSSFNQPIGDWDVSNVNNMGSMFFNTPFNQPIGNWDVSSVSEMGGMFDRNRQFNQDISGWCVSQIPEKPLYFDKDTPQWVLPKPVWGSCPD